MPFFSIIVPAFNCEKYIADCLLSVFSQDFDDWELLVIDDGSTDGTPSVIKEFFNDDLRAKYVRKENGGVSSARNLGLTMAKGVYVLFLDADDELAPGALALFASSAISKAAVVIASSQVVNGEGTSIGVVALPKDWNGIEPAKTRIADMDFPEKAPLLHYVWGRAYNLSALTSANVKFDESISLGEDFIFNCSVFGIGGEIQIIDGFVYRYARRGRLSLSNGFNSEELDRRRRMDRALWTMLQQFELAELKHDFFQRCVGAIALTSVEAVGQAGIEVNLEEKLNYVRGFGSSEYRSYIDYYVTSPFCGIMDRLLAKIFLNGANKPFIFLTTLKCKLK